jgi:hypothetical protein
LRQARRIGCIRRSLFTRLDVGYAEPAGRSIGGGVVASVELRLAALEPAAAELIVLEPAEISVNARGRTPLDDLHERLHTSASLPGNRVAI